MKVSPLQCPYCGYKGLVTTQEGLLVCPNCGAVIGEELTDTPSYSRAPSRMVPSWMKVRYVGPRRPVRRVPKPRSPLFSLDPLVEIVASRLAKLPGLRGRRPRTVAALSLVAVLIAKGWTWSIAIREAAKRARVGERNLYELARRYRLSILQAADWVAEAWRRAQTEENS